MVVDEHWFNKNLEYRMRILNNEMEYKESHWDIDTLLNNFNQNKENVVIKRSCANKIDDTNSVKDFIMHILTGQSCLNTIILLDDWSYMIGYEEIGALNNWINGKSVVIYDDVAYEFDKLPESYQEFIKKNTQFTVRMYDSSLINNTVLHKRLFGTNINVYKINQSEEEGE